VQACRYQRHSETVARPHARFSRASITHVRADRVRPNECDWCAVQNRVERRSFYNSNAHLSHPIEPGAPKPQRFDVGAADPLTCWSESINSKLSKVRSEAVPLSAKKKKCKSDAKPMRLSRGPLSHVLRAASNVEPGATIKTIDGVCRSRSDQPSRLCKPNGKPQNVISAMNH